MGVTHCYCCVPSWSCCLPMGGGSRSDQVERWQGSLGPCSPSLDEWEHTHGCVVCTAPLCRSHVRHAVGHKCQGCAVVVALLPLHPMEFLVRLWQAAPQGIR